MDVQRLTSYRAPSYPTQPQLAEQGGPGAHVPKRWLRSSAVLGALVACVGVPAINVLYAQAKVGGQQLVLPGDVAPPRCLSEQEARRIILAEAKRAGLSFSAKGPKVDISVAKPLKDGRSKTVHMSWRLDGLDAKRGVAFDYLSEDDTFRAAGHTTLWNNKHVLAQSIRAAATRTHRAGKFGVFGTDRFSSRDKQAAQLRQQVRDFVKWLKGQGVI